MESESKKIQCPEDLRDLLETEMAQNSLSYMLAMYWQGRRDKISTQLVPLLEWITVNHLPVEISQSWIASTERPKRLMSENHHELLTTVMTDISAKIKKSKEDQDSTKKIRSPWFNLIKKFK